jgi:error-prone DNA polymerase
MLQRADSVGVFQVESRAQMNMLPRLKPRTYYDLVIQVSIVRPGPIHGDMVHPYLKRRNGKEVPDYPMEALKPILERTYGVPLFQEQVIAFAMVAANFSAAEADQLRRSMASWRKKGHMHILQQRLRTNMLKNGFSEEYIARIQRQLEGFGEYGFPESHAASFALLVYITAWLKCHHPAIYLAALLNSQPMGFYSPAQLIEDARHHSVTIEAVDINHSNWDHSANHNAVRLGLRLVKGLQRDSALRLCEQRPIGGYKSIQECMRAANLNKHELEALASANAFGDLAEHRYHARWQVAEPQQGDLLRNDLSEDSGVWPLSAPNEVADLLEDYHSMGVTLGRHPIEILREQGHLGSSITALGLRQLNHGDECFVSGLVTCRQRPGTAAGVTFVTLEDETGCTNVVVWLRTAQQQLQTLLNARIMQVYGHVEKDSNSGVTHLMAYRLLDLSSALKQLEIKSHDFH